MGVQKSNAKPDNYMSARTSYKPGGKKYSTKSPLQHRKEYTEKLRERARKAAAREKERAERSTSSYANLLNSSSHEMDSLLQRITYQALRAIAIEADGFEVSEWGTDANGKPVAKKYADDRRPQNTTNVTMNSSDSNLYTANSNEGKYRDLIIKYAKEYNLDPNMVASIITIESTWDPNALSSANCQGLMQVNPRFNKGNLYDVETNIRLGCKIYRECLDACDGNVAHALVSYNMGITGAKNTYTSSYSNKVIAEYNRRTNLLAKNNNNTGNNLSTNA